jgi:hypothetical protein
MKMNWKINKWYLLICVALISFNGGVALFMMILDAPGWGEALGKAIALLCFAIIGQLFVYGARAMMLLVKPLFNNNRSPE